MLRVYKNIRTKYKSIGLIGLLITILCYPYKRLKWYFVLSNDIETVFKKIYSRNIWGSQESVSGVGSEKYYTENIRSWLVLNIPKYQIRNIVDSPCGDFNWMRYVLENVSVDYLGIDIVYDLIDRNTKKYSNKNISFRKSNIVDQPIPDCDLLIVRDCLFHFSYIDIDRFLKNINKTNYKFLLTTSHITGNDFKNRNIKTGDFRKINLFLPPFNFKENNILDIVSDYPKGHHIPRNMFLIKKDCVPKNISLSQT